MKIETPAPLNPSQPPLDRGGAERHGSCCPPDKVSDMEGDAALAPPLSRGGREGLGFIPYNKKLILLARENRKSPTAAESKMWNEVLRMRHFADYKFSRQKPIGNYIADFYCASLHLVIEIDGDSHAEAIAYDEERTKALAILGIKVVRYTNEEVLKNLAGVYDDLMRRTAPLDNEFFQ